MAAHSLSPSASPDAAARRWAVLRGVLGLAQMAGASAAVVLLALSGVTPLALGAVAATSVLTTASVLLFGSRPRA